MLCAIVGCTSRISWWMIQQSCGEGKTKDGLVVSQTIMFSHKKHFCKLWNLIICLTSMVDLSRSVFCWRKSISSLEIFDCDFPMIMFLEKSKKYKRLEVCAPQLCFLYWRSDHKNDNKTNLTDFTIFASQALPHTESCGFRTTQKGC